MRVHVMDLQPGDQLTKDIFNAYGLHVLSSETVLDGESISKLFCHNIDYVDIIRPDKSTAREESKRTHSLVAMSYEAGLAGVNAIFSQAFSEGKIDPKIVDTSFEPLADNFRKENNLVSLMLSLDNGDEYTYQHSLQVGMFAYYISKWLGHSEESALLAGKAGFLHDIGKSKIDPEILQKPAKLTEQEFEIIKQHTVYGKEILEQTYDSQSPIVLGALEHHERYDGSGYPHNVRSDKIHPVSKILAVADIYSAMISSRIYQKEKDMLFVLRELHRISFGEIDPHITQVFIRHMVPNFEGKSVILNTGEQGVILLTNPTDFFNPLIQVENHFVDLSKRPDLHIHKIVN
ncbi:HD-GYP domain-containing protein [Gorillibacterium sp. sgz5001074]|uniref:HD-GYP domain-containing protein n=1 Tax=Gorillibacterium sp. sgz5001074 TaxID=3446695 RepID=UPI003F673EA9